MKRHNAWAGKILSKEKEIDIKRETQVYKEREENENNFKF